MVRVVWVVWYREVLRFVRDPVRIFTSLLQPAAMLFVFARALGPSIGQLAAGVDFQKFMLPGAISMTVIFAAMFGATSIVWDQEFGFIKEILVAPTPRSAIVLGKVAGGSTVAVVQAALVVLFAPFVGISLSPGLIGITVGLSALLAVTVSALGTWIASAMRRLESFQAVTQIVMMPMFFLSGAMFPFRGLPGWLRFAVAINPVAYGVDPLRRAMLSAAGLPPEIVTRAGTGISILGHTLTTVEELVVLAALAVVLLGLAVWSFTTKEVGGGRRHDLLRRRVPHRSTRGVAIEAVDLVRRYGPIEAVKGISFEVAQGEIFGFLGPNGAGKTTTINMLCTLLAPTAGHAFVGGYDVAAQRDEVRRTIGLVFQEPALDDYLTAHENLLFHAISYRIPIADARRRIPEVLGRVDLADVARRRVITFSGGMKRRLELARGLLHTPRVLFLDEPTIGLDPQSRRHLWEYVEKLHREEGITVFLTTHYMEEAAICDRIAIIDHGRIVALDTPENLKRQVGADVIKVRTEDDARAVESLVRLGIGAVRDNGAIHVQHEDGERAILAVLRNLDVPLIGLQVHRPTLDDVFVSLTGRAIRDSEADNREKLLAQGRAGGGWGPPRQSR